MSYKFITNPLNKEKYNIHSEKASILLEKYVNNMEGGSGIYRGEINEREDEYAYIWCKYKNQIPLEIKILGLKKQDLIPNTRDYGFVTGTKYLFVKRQLAQTNNKKLDEKIKEKKVYLKDKRGRFELYQICNTNKNVRKYIVLFVILYCMYGDSRC